MVNKPAISNFRSRTYYTEPGRENKIIGFIRNSGNCPQIRPHRRDNYIAGSHKTSCTGWRISKSKGFVRYLHTTIFHV